jgi:ABC-2 type transport system permease protein
MRKVWAVIRREFVERVRTKWFLISTILGPVFMIGLMVLPALLTARAGGKSDVVLLDEGSPELAGRLEFQLERTRRFSVTVVPSSPDRHQGAADSLTREVQAQRVDGFFAVSPSTVESGLVEYRGRNVSSLRDMGILESTLRGALVTERLTRRGVDPAVVQEAQERIRVRTGRITRRGVSGESAEATFFLGYFVGLILYMVILLYGINVMRSVLEEKQTRIVEVLVSSLRPFQLMLGKVVGVGGVGLFQFSIWALAGYAMVRYRTPLLEQLGVPASATSSFQLPSVNAALVLISATYFFLGYLLYSSLFAVVGASCNTDSEAQQAQQPVMMLLVVSLMTMFAVLQDPGGELAWWASMIPFSSPIVMPIRVAASEVPAGQLALSVTAAIGGSLVVIWGSARIYRVGILMYGKRPGLRELLRWARQS